MRTLYVKAVGRFLQNAVLTPAFVDVRKLAAAFNLTEDENTTDTQGETGVGVNLQKTINLHFWKL